MKDYLSQKISIPQPEQLSKYPYRSELTLTSKIIPKHYSKPLSPGTFLYQKPTTQCTNKRSS